VTQQPDSTTTQAAPSQVPTFYERVGGHETFRRLVHEFYRGVAGDPPLRDLYPEEDLGPAEERLLLFLEQYWGGPTTYQETRGHPRLRMRHHPYKVTPAQRDRWLQHMHAAIDSIRDRLGPMDEHLMRDYMNRAAQAMVNALED
jgi:hemoglobin